MNIPDPSKLPEPDLSSWPDALLVAVRDLCPDGEGVTSITLSASDGRSVQLTAKSRALCDAEIRRRREAKKGRKEVGL